MSSTFMDACRGKTMEVNRPSTSIMELFLGTSANAW